MQLFELKRSSPQGLRSSQTFPKVNLELNLPSAFNLSCSRPRTRIDSLEDATYSLKAQKSQAFHWVKKANDGDANAHLVVARFYLHDELHPPT